MKKYIVLALFGLLIFPNLAGAQVASTSVTVLWPNTSQLWVTGTTHSVSWNAQGLPSRPFEVRWQRFPTCSPTAIPIASGLITSGNTNVGSFNSFNWTLPSSLQNSSCYKIEVAVATTTGTSTASWITDRSDSYFSIFDPSSVDSLTVVQPNGGERWEVGSEKTIFWTTQYVATSSQTQISWILDGLSSSTQSSGFVTASTSNSGSFNWRIPFGMTPGDNYLIRITTAAGPSDTSNNYFTIARPSRIPTGTAIGQSANISQAISPTVSSLRQMTFDQILSNLRENPKWLDSVLKELPESSKSSRPEWCYNFDKNMGVGDRGEQVRALRKAIGDDDEDNDQFDEKLASKIVQFQEKNSDEILKPLGLSRGSGYLGASTRKWLNRYHACGPKPYPPLPPFPSGSLQLFNPNGGEYWQKGTGQVIKWGGGNSSNKVDITLLPYCPANAICAQFEPRYLVATGLENSGYYKWPVGQVVGYEGYQKVPAGSYLLQICQAGSATLPLSASVNNNTESAVTLVAQGGCDLSDSYFKITDGVNPPPTGNRPPVISGVSGPTVLSVNQTGTWTVQASDPENGNLSYSVVWGDGPIPTVSATGISAPTTQSTTFTHQYAVAGDYSPTFIVTDASGQSARTSISVRVGDVVNPIISILEPKYDVSWAIGSNYTVKWRLPDNAAIPSTAVLIFSLVDGPTPTPLPRPTSPTQGSFSFVLPNSACPSDACTNLQPGNYHLKATLYDRQPCLGLCPANDPSYSARILAETTGAFFKVTILPIVTTG